MFIAPADPSTFQPTTLYTAFDWPGRIALEELEAALRKQERSLRHADRFDVLEALMQGRLKSVPVRQAAQGRNKIQDEWIKQTVGARLINNFTSVEDGVVRYLAVGQDYTSPSRTDAGLFREIFRAAPITSKQVGDHHKFIIHLDWDDANGAETTVNGSGATTTVIPVASTTGIYAGCAVRFQLGSEYAYSTVLSVGSGEITLVTAEALPSAPASGSQVLVCIGEAGIFGNTSASGTANSGACFSRSRLRYPKTDAYAPMVLGDMILVPA